MIYCRLCQHYFTSLYKVRICDAEYPIRHQTSYLKFKMKPSILNLFQSNTVLNLNVMIYQNWKIVTTVNIIAFVYVIFDKIHASLGLQSSRKISHRGFVCYSCFLFWSNSERLQELDSRNWHLSISCFFQYRKAPPKNTRKCMALFV